MKELKDALESLSLIDKLTALLNALIEDPDNEEQIFDIAYDHGYTEEQLGVVIRMAIVLKRHPQVDVKQLLEIMSNE